MAEEAVVTAGQALSQANEQSAATRERRAFAAARAEAQQEAQRPNSAQQSLDKFECVPQRLAQRLGFDAEELRDAEEESGTLERLTAERERIGPVNLVAEQELAELDDARNKGAPKKPRS